MNITGIPRRASALGAVAVLVLAACGDDDDDSADQGAPTTGGAAATGATATPGTTATAGTDAEMPPLPEWAAGMTLTLDSPSAGGTLTDNELAVNVQVDGYDLSCDEAGKPVVEGVGHYHLLLDGSLINMYCTPDATVSMQNVSPGQHTLAAVPAINDHAEVLDNEVEFEFDYEPSDPLPEITDKTDAGEPSITITSPKEGETVSGEFEVVYEVENFELNCDLFGKPALFGIGHAHVNLDASTGPMMGMGTMLGMSCQNSFMASTEGLQSGETHTVIALLTDNGHAPLGVEDGVDVTIG